MSPQADLEDRVERLERILSQVLDRARKHPVGRQILAMLGLQ